MQGDHHATYRLTKETATQGNVTYVAEYTYDDVGNRLSMSLTKTDGSNPPSQSVITYEYDANDRLTKSTLQGPPPFVAMAKTADDLYAESSSRRSHNGMKAFALAALGTLCVPVLLMRSRHRPLGRRARRRRIVNSVLLVFMALLMAVGPENVQAAYLNSALYQSLTAAGLAQVSETITTYQYDAAGNLTDEQRGTDPDDHNSYVYDAENHLRSATIRLDGDGQGFRFLSYTYDADGIRTSKTVKIGQGAETTTWYVVDKNRDYAQVLEERDANGTLAVRYVYGLDLIAQVRGTNPSYYHHDGLGSTRQLTDNPTNPLTDKPDVLNSYTYEAFGRRLESGTGDHVDNDYRFTGEQYDGQTSSYYLRARYFQPGTGRFTGRDAADGYTSDPITQHKYLYTGADPVNRVDPSGLSFGLGGQIAVGAIVGGLISAGDAYGSGAKVKDIVKAAVIGAAIGAALAPLSFVKYLGTGLGVAGIGIGAYFTYDAYAIQQNPPLAFYRGVMTALGAFALVYGYVRAMQLRNAAPKSPEEIGQILAAENAVGPDMSNAAGRTIYRHVPRKSPAYPSQKDGVVEPYGETAPDNLPIRADRHDDGYTKGSGLTSWTVDKQWAWAKLQRLGGVLIEATAPESSVFYNRNMKGAESQVLVPGRIVGKVIARH